jgi:hypothetical protein
MNQTSERIRGAVTSIGRMVERDGGQLAMTSYDLSSGILTIDFTEGPEQYCSVNGECAFTRATVEALLTQSLKSMGLAEVQLVVRDSAGPA